MAQIILDSNNNLIQGDFDNATLNNRTKLQTTTTNATTNVYVVPNGSSTSAGVSVANNSNLTNASKIVMATNGTTDTQIISGVNGSGTYLPLSFYTNNALAMQISTGGSLGVGTSDPSPKITVARTATTSVTNASYYLGLGGTENLLNSKRLIGMGYSSGSTDEYPTAMGYVETDNGGYTKGAISFYTRDVTTNTAPTERMRIDSRGNLLLGTTTPLQSSPAPDHSIQIKSSDFPQISYQNSNAATSGSFWLSGQSTNDYWYLLPQPQNKGVYLTYTSTTGWSSFSDETLKENLVPIENALNKINTLRTVTGNFIDDPNTPHVFLIAQDVKAVLPEAVHMNLDHNVLGMNYNEIIPLLTAGIKELKAENDTLKTQLSELKTRIEALESK